MQSYRRYLVEIPYEWKSLWSTDALIAHWFFNSPTDSKSTEYEWNEHEAGLGEIYERH